MIKTLTLHNNDITPRHNGVGEMSVSIISHGVGPTHGPHSIVPWCCVIVVLYECKDHSPS